MSNCPGLVDCCQYSRLFVKAGCIFVTNCLCCISLVCVCVVSLLRYPVEQSPDGLRAVKPFVPELSTRARLSSATISSQFVVLLHNRHSDMDLGTSQRIQCTYIGTPGLRYSPGLK